MYWLIIFLLILCGFCLNGCSLIPKIPLGVSKPLPTIKTHIGKNDTKVAVARDTNNINRPIYIAPKVINMSWKERTFYYILLFIALNTKPIMPPIKRGVKKVVKKLAS